MTNSQDLITERVVSTAERIEEMDDPDELEPLEVRVEAGLDGQPYSFTAVLGTGGPHIEVNVTKGIVRGHWGSDSHTTHVNNEDVLGALDEQFARYWEDNIIA